MPFHEDFRSLVPVTNDYVYLNHAAISPTPLPVLYETLRYLFDVSRHGSIPVNNEESDDLFHLREKIAKLINADAETISFIPNTSYGINMIVHGLDLNEEDNIVTDSLEFPAVTHPLFKLKKVKIKMVKPKIETLEEEILSAIDSKTRLVAVSHVSYNTGVMLDLKRIAKEVKSVGGYLLADVIQSAGASDVNVKEFDVDFAVAGGYKWLMSPQGSGFMYVRKGLIEDPPWYGWRASKDYLQFIADKFEVDKGPRRFEIGTIDIGANIGLAKSCEIIYQHKDEIFSRIKQLSDLAIKYAEEKKLEVVTPKDKKAGIVIVKVPNPKEIANKLLMKRIVVSPRGNGIRISTHFYNNEEEVMRTIDEISNLLTFR